MSISINDPSDIVEEKFRKGLDKMRNIIKFENLRTLMLFGNYDARFVRIFSDILKNAKSLRVVLLSTTHFPVECLLHNFSKLVHLRYLRLLFEPYGCKEHLPTSISRYYHLRVLDISDWHGYLSLLGDMANLVKLRHLLISSINNESHPNICNVGKLRSLQELQRFDVRKEKSGFEFRELGKLEELGGSLGIYNLENAVVDEAHEAKLSYKNRLKKLTLDWKEGRSNTNPASEDQLLESLRPPNNIHELSIKGHGGSTCPTWLGTNLSARGLEALCLDNTDWESLPPLGELYLVHGTGEEYLGCIRGLNFHNLKRLELIGLPRFRRWVANEFCPWYFSIIEVLIVKNCPELTELPFSSYATNPPEGNLNATWFPRLKEIRIENCPQLLSLPPIPFSHTFCSIILAHVGRGLKWLHYFNKYIFLEMKGNDALPSLDETVLAFQYLTQLEELSIENCPPLAGEHLQMLTSLKTFKITGSSITFLPLARSDVKWQLLVTRLDIARWSGSTKELTHLLCHLPVLSILAIDDCDKITRLGVEAEQKRMASSLSMPASSVVKLQDTHGTSVLEVEEDVVAEEVVAEQQQEEDNGLLLLPSHLSNSLQDLRIGFCLELILIAHNHGAGGGGLQLMHSLKSTEIKNCPKFLSAYKASGLTSFCPFPSSLQHLELAYRMEGMDTLVPLSNLTSLQNLKVWNMGEDFRCGGLLPLLTQGQLTTLEVTASPKFFAGWDPAQALQGGQEQPSSKLQELETGDIGGVLTLPICRLIFPSLAILLLYSNEEVKRFTKKQEEALSLLTSLQELRFWWWDKLWCLPSGLHKLTSLKTLWIYNCPVIRSLPKNGLPSSLQELRVDYCIQLRCLPAGLHKLTNLKRLEIRTCPAIGSLPKNGLPCSLTLLDVRNCRNKKLKQRCRQLVGTIPQIRLLD
jgi:Leucine-rich repeat (LRR) protein